MSSAPQIVVGVGIYRAGAAPNIGYTHGSDGATPLLPRRNILMGLLRLSPLSV